MNDDDLKNNTNTPSDQAQSTEPVEDAQPGETAKSDVVKTSDEVEPIQEPPKVDEAEGAKTDAAGAEQSEAAELEKQDQPSGQSGTTPDEQPTPAPTPKKNDNPNAKWYVVHTYSGHENKVAATLKQRIESEHLEKKILDILVPTQDKIEIKGGKKTEVKEKIFPGYILVKMDLDDTSWLAVRTTQGVTSFVGIGNKPTPISEAEVATIVKFTQEAAPTFKQVFAPDDTVRIVEGPFAEFIGKVDSVDEEKGKVRVLVSIFGRETPVELDFLQVQKI